MTQLSFDDDDPTKTPFPSMQRWAVISADEKYRYLLGRRWAPGELVEWVMLNPSTADAQQDDHTIRRCMGFARDWGYAGIQVKNLFAMRTTYPMDLLDVPDPIGPENYDYLRRQDWPITIAAWGSDTLANPAMPHLPSIPEWDFIDTRKLMCIGYNYGGSPKHPLYVPKGAQLRPWPEPN
jgi:hypothetical protein